jgi:hypothetical protein
MQTKGIIQKLLQYFDNSKNDADYSFTAGDIKAFDERRERRLNGESRTYKWEDAKKIITQSANR